MSNPGTDGSTATPSEHGRIPSTLRFPVVGLGASAGGVEALISVFGHLPPDSGMAFVVILHLSPDFESTIDRILQRTTPMRVLQVVKPVPIEANHVYVISPSKTLTMNDGYLQVSEAKGPRGSPAAIDLFFRTLADAHLERAVSVVLSGTGTDGTVGMSRIKEQGGVTIAQAPDDAQHDGMPHSAIQSGMVDFVLPAAAIADKLLDIWRNAQSMRLPPDADLTLAVRQIDTSAELETADQALAGILAALRQRTGHDFRRYKRATVLRRVERRLQVNGLSGLPAYRHFLAEHPEETPRLLKDMLISVTNFFRDGEAFEAIETEVVARLFDDKGDDDAIRVWAAGCATGEEAYSLAMLLAEYGEKSRKPNWVQVFATDIDAHALDVGRAGRYPEAIMVDVKPARLHRFFVKEQDHYRIKKAVRERILFASHNLLHDPSFSQLDLVCCRNVLIYLDREAQKKVLQAFHHALHPGGFLFLGGSESVEVTDRLFAPFDKKNRIYRAKSVAAGRTYGPLLPPRAHADRLLIASGAQQRALRAHRDPSARLHHRALEQYAPPSLIVDQHLDIVHTSESAGRFLRYASGNPSHNVTALVQPELRLELRTALYQAMQSGKPVETGRVRTERDGRVFDVDIIVRPFDDAGEKSALVLFNEVEEAVGEPSSSSAAAPAIPGARASAGAAADDDAQVRHLKRQLHDMLEQAETSTEELKASNEELQAINEELRSATEELETSKEELQSVNEELITVNYELKTKVEETGRVNDDLQNLISSTDIATVFVDRTMCVRRYTPRAAEIFNLIASDIGRSLLDITHRLNYEFLAEDATAAFEQLKSVEREVRGNGGRWFIARVLPYRSDEDRIDGAVLTFIDITARHEAQERLRSSEARMKLVIESTNDYAIIVLDDTGSIVTWNQGAQRIFGYREDEVIGMPVDLIFLPDDRARGVPAEELRNAARYGRAEDERWHVRKDGKQLYCSGVMTPLRSAQFQGYAKIVRDLTDKQCADVAREEQLAQERIARAQIEATNRLKDEFLAVMSHELKHPLNLIHVNAELMMRLPEVKHSAPLVRAAQTIQKSVLGQAKIIDDLLDLSRLNTGKLRLNRVALDLRAVVGNLVELGRGDGAARGVSVSLEAPAAPLMVAVDPVRLEQIVWNILGNALKFTPDGGRVSVTLAAEAHHARIDVVDTGQGIDPSFLPKIFNMFDQAEGPTTRHAGGLGIGLALVRQLTELHEGSVQVASDGVGRGAHVTVRLPLHDPHATPEQAAAQAPGAVLKGMRILLIDDSIETLEAFRQLLIMEQAEVRAEMSGTDALAAASHMPFDLILSDISMPGMDGYALISALRKVPALGNVPALALTGMGRQDDAVKALEAGFDGHLSKPVTLDALLHAIGACVTPPARPAGPATDDHPPTNRNPP